MTPTTTVSQLYVLERDRLVAELRGLDRDQWAAASLCQGWSLRDLTAHLLMPYELTVTALLPRIVLAGFNFDRLADRWARRDRRTGPELVDALATTTAEAFAVPGAGELAPLAHLVTHAQDVRAPLGLAPVCDPTAAVQVLNDITRGPHSVGDHVLTGVRLVATDTDWRHGDIGPTVSGHSSVLANALMGRHASVDALDGDGVAELRSRVTS